MMRRMMSCGLAMLVLLAAQQAAHAGLVVYGLTTGGRIDSVDVSGRTDTTMYTNASLGTTNGLAIDVPDHLLIFGSTTSSSQLEYYNLATNTAGAVTGTGVTGSISNAAFYNGSYYFVQENSNVLEKVTFSQSSLTGGAPSISSVTNITLSGAPSLGFGDIAITSNGTLYGSSTVGLFSVNLGSTSGSTNSSYSLIKSGSTLYQIALDPTQTFLYAEHDATNNTAGGGTWGTIALSGPGAGTFVASSPAFTTFGFGDIADQTLVTPEPTTFVMLGLAGAIGLAQSKLRKRRKAPAA